MTHGSLRFQHRCIEMLAVTALRTKHRKVEAMGLQRERPIVAGRREKFLIMQEKRPAPEARVRKLMRLG